MSNIKLTWTDPTTLNDGTSAIPSGDFGYVDVQMSADGGKTFASLGHVNPGTQTYTVTDLPPGTYAFNVTAVDTQTPPLTSAAASVSITIPLGALAPVTALAAQII